MVSAWAGGNMGVGDRTGLQGAPAVGRHTSPKGFGRATPAFTSLEEVCEACHSCPTGFHTPTPKTSTDVVSNLVTSFFLPLGWGRSQVPLGSLGKGGATDAPVVSGRGMVPGSLGGKGQGLRPLAQISLRELSHPLSQQNTHLMDELTEV